MRIHIKKLTHEQDKRDKRKNQREDSTPLETAWTYMGLHLIPYRRASY